MHRQALRVAPDRGMKIPGEIWKQIPDYPRYDVSNFGRVRSWYRGRWGIRVSPRILTPGICNGDYRHVALVWKNKKHTKLLHVLVAEAFLGSRPECTRIAHKDRNRGNNTLKNLVYVEAKAGDPTDG